MKHYETLDYKPKITWQYLNGFQLRGFFKLDDRKIEIQIDEYKVEDKILVDFGFVVDGYIQAVEGKKSKAKLLAAVYNGANEKIKQINPDLLLFFVIKSSGLVESKKSIYLSLARLLQRTYAFVFDSDWVENEYGFYRIWSKMNLSKDKIDLFIAHIQNKWFTN